MGSVRLLYWALILIVSVLCLVISVEIFNITFGIKPVLWNDCLDLRDKKRNLVVMGVAAALLFFIATTIALLGGI